MQHISPVAGDKRLVILVVEDDLDLALEIQDTLRDYGMHAVIAETWPACLEALAQTPPALVLLDQRLGQVDTVPLLPRLREATGAPIIILTGNREEADRIVALEMGADDFLLKPISGRELVARIRAHMRRDRPGQSEAAKKAKSWQLDLRRRMLARPDGTEIDLTSAEFDLLATLAETPGHAIDRDTLTQRVLHRAWHADDRSLDNLVVRLRRKLGAGGDKTIATIRGQGYAFTGFRDS